ncbi:DUF3718 domain-containing protein [Thalassomonas sp. M1454]|uniref:DUF3718 domain-containing protein n=1 Tax=Thalassomonas sp. M1454 TaxID=2594477 RepID=UPI00117F17CF|nr:DUF3718 domain-containing protein [Thalassomonas sp. M1454]TRX53995.1 DUF3718 domain-containing protein [Thalassomonas sp. M1454]
MKTLTKIAAVSLTSASLLVAFNSSATMDNYMESALIDVCKKAQQDNVLQLRKTIKGYRLNEKTVAMGLMCNGENVISFAENNGAFKTANHLDKKLGGADIVDIAQVYSVKF